MHRVYISASTQKENIGILSYGTEEERMQLLADMVAGLLERQRKFLIFRNKAGWKLSQTVRNANDMMCEIFVDLHSNAGIHGTESYYHVGSENGFKLATLLYKYVSIVSKGFDTGIKKDTSLYKNGLYVLRTTKMPACLIEVIDHTYKEDVEHFINNMDLYSIAIARAICDYFKEEFIFDKKQEIKISSCKSEGTKYLKDKNYTKELHNALDLIDFGTLGTIIKNMERIKKD